MRRASLSWGIVVTVTFQFFVLSSDRISAALLDDDFTTFDTGTWTAAPYLQATTTFAYGGLPQFLIPTTLDGKSVLRTTSIMGNEQIRGFGSIDTFNLSSGKIELDFKTMPLVDPTVPAAHDQNIDGICFLYVENQATGKFINFGVFGSSAGAFRNVITDSNIDSTHVEEATGVWDYNTYYRLVMEFTAGQSRVSLQSAAGVELYSHTRNFGLSALGGPFHVAIGQTMGIPNAEYYADAALDRITVVATVPEPPTDFLCVIGAGMVLLTPLISRRICHSRKKT